MITLENVSKHYGQKSILKNIKLQFSPGKVYGIVGKNGAGKTTLFRCIAGLESFEGAISSTKVPLKNQLGFLVTEPFFFAKMTGKEYIQLLCNARKVALGNLDQRNIFDLPLNQHVTSYSTGMKKKLAITALLIQGNEYFILDEPFNGLDIQSNMLMVELILKLKALNKIVLISSHIFATLAETCDEIHLLHAGKIIRSVMPDEFSLLASEMKAHFIGNSIERMDLK